MSDVKCPYCGHEQEINHDDGYGYNEDERFYQCCANCKKEFGFETRISYDYQVFCEGQHDLEQGYIYENLWTCSRCDYYEVRRVKTSLPE